MDVSSTNPLNCSYLYTSLPGLSKALFLPDWASFLDLVVLRGMRLAQAAQLPDGDAVLHVDVYGQGYD